MGVRLVEIRGRWGGLLSRITIRPASHAASYHYIGPLYVYEQALILSLRRRLNVLDARHVKTRRPCRPLFANLSKLVLFSAVFALISGVSRWFSLL